VKPTVWRDAVRDRDLDRAAKLVAFVISTYMNGAGEAWQSKETIAKGAGLGKGRRSVDQAVDRIEAAGFLEVERSKGHRSFRDRATAPNVARDASSSAT
jgi:DNA-binding transcriptional regulator PaaX